MLSSSFSRPPPHPHHPVVFEEFFDLALEERASPFLTPAARRWSHHLPLKAALLSALFWILSLFLSFSPQGEPLSLFLLLLVYFFSGIPSLIEAIEDLFDFNINIDVLMVLAAFSAILIGSGREGALLLLLFALSGAMEDSVTAKARGSLSHLHKLAPTKACVIQPDGEVIERAVGDISPGTCLLVRAGQVVPLDGVVVEGISSVNLVHLTGESVPIRKQKGDEVAAGALNLEGVFTLKVTQTSSDSTLARIIQLVTQAQEARPALQKWFDRVSRGYAITIIMLSLSFGLGLPFFYPIPFLGLHGSWYRSIAFLIAASPCALIIALPIAYLSAIGACARRGILLKGGISLDALASCRAVAFDKTGTLTTGELTCSQIEILHTGEGCSLEEALSVAVELEKNAVHPIARSIVAYGQTHPIQPIRYEELKTIPGYGLEAQIHLKGRRLIARIGSYDLLHPFLSSALQKQLTEKMESYRQKGESLTFLQVGQALYLFRLSDTIRPGIKETIASLKSRWNLLPIMLTGDHQESAQRVAKELAIPQYHANLKPEDKLSLVSALSKEGLAMIGDGINDAPALARATVGIGMGKVGSSAALEASEIIFLQDNIEQLDWLFAKAMATQRIVRQNLLLASSAICFASLPALAGWVPLWLAVLLHEGGTVLVGLNSLRLLKS